MRDCVLAVDVGGTKLAAGLVGDDGRVLEHAMVPTPHTTDADVLFGALAELVDGIDRTGARATGVGCGGPMAPGGGAGSPLNIPAWRAFPLRGRLAEHLGLPVWVDNDAKALALGEGWRGAAAGHDSFIGMVVSTGIGGGIVLEGRLLDGAGGNAGH